ncbi:hypothetical protein PRIPAC_80396 [Pristionchus pacificus]|uniref:Uncharacterized protein n=1 Tax=Pristionchus pacificus TaxID=54126 RepID=A0A2A6CNC3_PRIPA|nr:hypothetical protein PRIPAC_80396 [Pristionchus pacificus]|eukprot:PDM79619.1 hypothetical protein PRIPAC_32198 [Pristionchus pacificus]
MYIKFYLWLPCGRHFVPETELSNSALIDSGRSIPALPLHSIPPILPLHSLTSPLIVPLLLHSQLQSSLLSSFLAASLTGQNSFQQVNNIHFHHS